MRSLTQHPTRNTYLSKHHLHPKKRGGTRHYSNILRLWRDKHNSWHHCFGQLNLDEIIGNIKNNTIVIRKVQTSKHWIFLFKDKTNIQIVLLLQRVRKMKLVYKQLKLL